MSPINNTKDQVEKTQQAVIDQVINLEIPRLAQKIFNHITTAKLMELCKVSKTWRQLIVDEIFMGTRIHKDVITKKPFTLACIAGNANLAEMLLNHPKIGEMDVNSRSFSGMTALMYACKLGHTKVVKLLLDHSVSKNIDLNAQSQSNRTALMYACEYGQEGPVELLLTYDGCQQIDFNKGLKKKIDLGRTALMLACEWGHDKVVRLFLQHAGPTINLNQTDSFGLTAFEMAVRYEYHEVMTLFLETHGINWNAKDSNGYTIFIKACKRSSVQFITTMLENATTTNFDPNVRDSQEHGWTAFMHACHDGQTEVVKVLLDYAERRGIQLDAMDVFGRTGLMIALEKGQDEVFNLLIEESVAKHISVPSKSEIDLDRFMTMDQEIKTVLEERWKIMAQLENEVFDGFEESKAMRAKMQDFELNDADTYDDMLEDLEFMEDYVSDEDIDDDDEKVDENEDQ